MATPKNKGRELDAFNDALRANPQYRAFLQSMGVDPDRPVNLSGSQRSRAEDFVRRLYPDLPGKFQIDPAGNVNTDHGLSTAWSNPYFRTALIAGGGLTGLGLAGIGPLAGLGGGGSAATGGTLASSSIPGLHAAVPGAVASQGASAALAAPLASGTVAGLHAAIPGAVASQGVSGAIGGVPVGGMGLSDGGSVPDVAGIGDRLKDALTDPQKLLGLAGVIGALASRGGGAGASGGAADDNLDRLSRITEARMRRVDPLHQAMTQLAFSRLPTRSRDGITLTNVPLPE